MEIAAFVVSVVGTVPMDEVVRINSVEERYIIGADPKSSVVIYVPSIIRMSTPKLSYLPILNVDQPLSFV